MPKLDDLVPYQDALPIPPKPNPYDLRTQGAEVEITVTLKFAKDIQYSAQLKPTHAWTYEGTVPGPCFVVDQKQTVHVGCGCYCLRMAYIARGHGPALPAANWRPAWPFGSVHGLRPREQLLLRYAGGSHQPRYFSGKKPLDFEPIGGLTIRLTGHRFSNGSCRARQPAATIHIYDMFWADLSRLGHGALDPFGELLVDGGRAFSLISVE
jgi:hypothetical protein